jgi:hypothetical protein
VLDVNNAITLFSSFAPVLNAPEAHAVIAKPHYDSSRFTPLNTKIAPQITVHLLFFAEWSNHVENVTTQEKMDADCVQMKNVLYCFLVMFILLCFS